jgi:hypothetical protein
MNENELKTYCLEHAGEQLPADAEAMLQRNPDLKRHVDQLIAVRNLISLKHYEQPSDVAMNRCMRGIHEQVVRRPVGFWAKVQSWFEFEQPAMAYGVAALALAVVGGLVALNRPAAEGPVVAVEAPVVMESVVMVADVPDETVVETLASIEPTAFPAFDKPLIFLGPDTTNIQPTRSGMTIGGGQIVPVSFDY